MSGMKILYFLSNTVCQKKMIWSCNFKSARDLWYRFPAKMHLRATKVRCRIWKHRLQHGSQSSPNTKPRVKSASIVFCRVSHVLVKYMIPFKNSDIVKEASEGSG